MQEVDRESFHRFCKFNQEAAPRLKSLEPPVRKPVEGCEKSEHRKKSCHLVEGDERKALGLKWIFN